MRNRKYRLVNATRVVAAGALSLLAGAVVFAASLGSVTYASRENQGGHVMPWVLSSPSFTNGGEIPRKFTCDGADVSPELSWLDPPAGTQSFALIADDPDAPVGTWTHWVLFDLPASTRGLPENVSKVDELPTGGRQGRNDFRKIGYGGPCPPAGKPHRYFFKLYALSTQLNLKPGASKQEVEQAMARHILGKTELMGKYRR